MGEERREELNREEYKEQEGAAALPEKTQERENAPEAEEKTEDLESSYEFIRETIKAKPINKKKMARQIGKLAGSGAVFGLAAALVEGCLRFGVGARVGLGEIAERDGIDLFTLLFSESLGRVVVSVPRSEEVRFKDMCTARDYPFARIGVVDAASNALDIQGEVAINLDELREAHEGTLAHHFGEVAPS